MLTFCFLADVEPVHQLPAKHRRACPRLARLSTERVGGLNVW